MRLLTSHPPGRSTARRATAALAATGLVLAGAIAGLGPGTSLASSHREAPLIAADPAADNTDTYAFVSPDRPGYVTFIANWIPFEEPNGGPNFYPFATDAAYNINVDSDGDGKPNASFRWSFKNQDRRGGDTFLYNNGPVTSLDDPNLLFRQTYDLEASFNGGAFQTRVSNAPVAPSRVGRASMPNYSTLRQQATKTLPGGWKIFAGQADDPFFLDLRAFDLLYGGDLSETGIDTLAGYNVNTIALQVPFKDVALKGDAKRNPVIGVWATTDRAKVRITGTSPTGIVGPRAQVSRLGNPLVNELIAAANQKDGFNASRPDQDAQNTALVNRVLDPELARLIQLIYGIPAPATPRNDLKEIYLTGITTKTADGPIKVDLNSQLNNADVDPTKFVPSEQMRLNLGVPPTAVPNRLGVLGGDLGGFPNGRRLENDVVDISLQAVVGAAQTGKLVDALKDGDRVDANDNPFSPTFPYVALPNVDAVNTGGGSSNTAVSDGPTKPAVAPAAPAANSGSTADDAPAVVNTAAQQTASDPNQELVRVAAVSAIGAGGLALVAATAFFLWYRRRRPISPATAGQFTT